MFVIKVSNGVPHSRIFTIVQNLTEIDHHFEPLMTLIIKSMLYYFLQSLGKDPLMCLRNKKEKTALMFYVCNIYLCRS